MSSPLAAPPAMISVRHVRYDYPGCRALDDVSFDLPPASITALVGPNGAGKTTLLRAMAALEEPMYGEIFVNGLNIWEAPREAHRLMGYLPDHFGLYQELSAYRCLLYAAYARGLSENEAEQAARWAAKEVGLVDKLEERAGTLSRGQRQRLALAQAIVHRPKVLLLDEPASGLDPEARADLSRLMKNLAAGGMTLLISSHILAELESYCTAMLVLGQGRLLSHQNLEYHRVAEARRVFRLRLSDQKDLSTFPDWLLARRIDATATEEAAVWHLAVPLDETAQAALLHELSADWNVLEFHAVAEAHRIFHLRLSDRKDLSAFPDWLLARRIDASTTEEAAVWHLATPLDETAQAALLRELAADWDVLEFTPHTRNLQEVYLETVAARKEHTQ